MNRRELLQAAAIGSGASLLLKTPTAFGLSQTSSPIQTQPVMLVSELVGVEIYHPRSVVGAQRNSLYADSIIQFVRDGRIALSSGLVVKGVAGDSFKVKVFKNRNGDVVKRVLVRGVDPQTALVLAKNRKNRRLGITGGQ